MHEEALTKIGVGLFPRLGQFQKFYLAGGTALALQIGHRLSADFDLFSEEKLSPRLLSKVKQEFAPAAISVTYRSPEQLNVLIDNIKATFFNYEYPVVDNLKKFKGVPIVSIREIAAMKAFSIGKRLSYKDYVDWYFLLKEKHVGLLDVITHAQKKFGGDFNDRLFLGQLVSIEDIATQKIDFLRGKVSRSTVQKFLTRAVKTFKI